MKFNYLYFSFLLTLFLVTQVRGFASTSDSLQGLAQQFLRKVKVGEETKELETVLSNYSFENLRQSLNTDLEKKTFWINIYNAYFQLLTSRENKINPQIYHRRFITIAQNHLVWMKLNMEF